MKEKEEKIADGVSISIQRTTAELIIGNLHVGLKNITFTKRQIKHIKKYFGLEVRNIEEK